MNKAELQKQSAEDVKEVQALMKSKGIRVEARQQLNTNTGFIELVCVFISEKRLAPEVAPETVEEPKLVDVQEADEHAA